MKNLFKCTAALLVSSALSVAADVVVDFNYGGANLSGTGGGQVITLDFAIDGAGTVSLDASAVNNTAAIVTAVEAWDSPNVGTVSDPGAFGTTFTLSGLPTRDGSPGNFTMRANDTGILAIQGENSGRIDGAAPAVPAIESIDWLLTDSSGNLSVDFKSWTYGNAATAGAISDARLVDSDTAVDFVNVPGSAATVDISSDGFALADGQALSFTLPATGTHGLALSGFTFDVTVIPEPSTGVLLGVGVSVLLMNRRRRRRD